MLKKRSNHRESTKRGVIKGYSDRARALCDQQYLEQELTNIEDVFVENGYSRKEVKGAMKIKLGRNGTDKNDESETNTRGIISIPNVPKLTQQFNKIAKKHRFKTTTKADNKVRDVTAKARTPIGEKDTNVTYNIPCGCEGYSYTAETNRMWKTRKREHMDKVRLTKQDFEGGRMEMADKRMNTGDGGLAKHSTHCGEAVKWEKAKIIGKEINTTKRKFLEGIETLKERSRGVIPLNTYNQMDPWQPTIYAYMEKR